MPAKKDSDPSGPIRFLSNFVLSPQSPKCSAQPQVPAPRFMDAKQVRRRHPMAQCAVNGRARDRTSKEPKAFSTRTGLCRHSNRSLFASWNSAGKRFGEPRNRGGIFCDTGRFRAVETALSRVSVGKTAECQRLSRRRQENRSAQDCVVELAGLEPPGNRLCETSDELLAEHRGQPIALVLSPLRCAGRDE